MDSVAQDILETIETFRKQGVNEYDPALNWHYSKVLMDESRRIAIKIPNPTFHQPPVLFEERYGLKGISENYLLPEGVLPTNLQTYVMLINYRSDLSTAQKLDKMAETYKALVVLNPKLQELKYDVQNKKDIYHLIMGIASGFNVNDLKYFLSEMERRTADPQSDPPAIKMEKSEAFMRLSSVFNRQAKVLPNFNWIPSPETLDQIREQFQQKFQASMRRDIPPAI